ncbi:MAG: c-type cytochrome [Myxococcota bacterium]
MPDREPPVEPGEGAGPEVEQLHRAIMREPPEPLEGREPAPWWFLLAVALTLFSGGFYLGRHGASFDLATHVGWSAAEEDDAGPGGPAVTTVAGAEVYTQRCASCHQADGKGLAGAFPPLVGSEWVTGDPVVPVRIVLDGLTGPITVAGQPYQGVMPAWRDQMTDAEIAAVVTHEREMSGVAGPPVDEALVARERAAGAGRGPWTAAELRP